MTDRPEWPPAPANASTQATGRGHTRRTAFKFKGVTMTDTLSFTQYIQASPSAAYHAFTNQAALPNWLCNVVNTSVRVGGPLFLEWVPENYYVIGEFTTLQPDSLIAFTWRGRGEPATTQVQVSLTPSDEGVQVTLTHSGLGDGETWQGTRIAMQDGWQRALANLKKVLETGLDDRIYSRPFLGIYLAGAVSADEAAALQLPISGGIRISGAAADTGAAGAGLQAGDILLRLAGVDLVDFAALRQALSAQRAGDIIDVVYFRTDAVHSAPMRLSSRPILVVPTTPAELSAAVRTRYAEVDAELDALAAGVSEQEACLRTVPDQWSAKEILAHLITSERGMQMTTASLCDNQTLLGWPNNPPVWVAALTGTHSFASLIQVWKQAEAETVAMLSALPDDLVARKADYRTVGEAFLHNFPNHTQTHLAEMRAAIAAARQHELATDPM